MSLVAEKQGLKEALAQEFAQSFQKLSKEKRQRVAKLMTMLEEVDDPVEAGEVALAIIEIVMPEVVMPESPGAADPLVDDADPEAKLRVDAYHGEIGRTIMKLREQREWTQDQLAEKAGLLQSHISRLEVGKHSPTRKTIRKIADAMGVKPSEIDLLYDE